RPRASHAVIVVHERRTQAGPSCRGKSPAVFTVASQILHQLFECKPRHRFAWGQRGKWPLCRGQPALLNAFFLKRGEARFQLIWHDLSDSAAAVSDDDGLPGCRQTNVLAELVLQDLQPDLAHRHSGSSSKLLRQFVVAAKDFTVTATTPDNQ